ncbi:MAG: hypothetical protein KDA20_08830 [Phycisphaerales bacterium]|nr:hypothetical protein [Phycisphaerales bacterium]
MKNQRQAILGGLLIVTLTLTFVGVMAERATRPDWPSTGITTKRVAAKVPVPLVVKAVDLGTSEEAQADLKLLAVPIRTRYMACEYVDVSLFIQNDGLKEWVVARPSREAYPAWINELSVRYAWRDKACTESEYRWNQLRRGRCPVGEDHEIVALYLRPRGRVYVGQIAVGVSTPASTDEVPDFQHREFIVGWSAGPLTQQVGDRLLCMPAIDLVAAPVELTISNQVRVEIEQIKPLPRSDLIDYAEYFQAWAIDTRPPDEVDPEARVTLGARFSPVNGYDTRDFKRSDLAVDEGRINLMPVAGTIVRPRPSDLEYASFSASYQETGWNSAVIRHLHVEWEPLP